VHPPSPSWRAPAPLLQLRSEAGRGPGVQGSGAASVARARRRPGRDHAPGVQPGHGRPDLSDRRRRQGFVLRDVDPRSNAAAGHRCAAGPGRPGPSLGWPRPHAAPVGFVRGRLQGPETRREAGGAGVRPGRGRRRDAQLPRKQGQASAGPGRSAVDAAPPADEAGPRPWPHQPRAPRHLGGGDHPPL
ncbi:MAG: hypothetical protein AVDCRST_MAG76-1701, partial [uncultured Acidimicrobiales bacterium]